MKQRIRGHLPTIFAGAIGLTLFFWLILIHGPGQVLAALAVAGSGLPVIAAYHLVPLFTNGIGWRALMPHSGRPGLLIVTRARWISESVNGLLPVAQIGGNVVRAVLMARAGLRASIAGATVVVDVTMNVAAQIAFTVCGLGLLLITTGPDLAGPVLIGTAVMALLLAGFYLSQRRGLFGGGTRLLARLSARIEGSSLVSNAAELDTEVQRLYGESRALLAAATWHFVSWVLGAGEIWLGLYFLGRPASMITALLMESLGQALRSAAFLVPGAIGIQEGGYLLLGGLFGIDANAALALSLIKRTRELILGIPGLFAWFIGTAASRQPDHKKNIQRKPPPDL